MSLTRPNGSMVSTSTPKKKKSVAEGIRNTLGKTGPAKAIQSGIRKYANYTLKTKRAEEGIAADRRAIQDIDRYDAEQRNLGGYTNPNDTSQRDLLVKRLSNKKNYYK